MPHEILALPPYELGLMITTYQYAKQHEKWVLKGAKMVFPVVVMAEV